MHTANPSHPPSDPPSGAQQRGLLNAILRGRGAIAQSLQQAIAVATRGVYIGGTNSGIVNTGFQLTLNHYHASAAGRRRLNKRQLAQSVQSYLEWMQGFCDQVSVLTEQPAPGAASDAAEARIDLERVFVPLPVIERGAAQPPPKPPSCEHLLALARHKSVVLLADAGQGKSMALLNLARQLCRHLLLKRGWEDVADLRRKLGFDRYADLAIPFYLPLNVFAEAQRSARVGLREYLDQHLQQQHLGLPPDFFGALIDHDRPVVLLLDGLDEILDQNLRETVAEHVRNLSQGKRCARFVITCRPAAYRGHVRMGSHMAHFEIAPFDHDRLDKIVRVLYLALCAGSGQDARKTKALLNEIERLEEERRKAGETAPLIDSPLMAALAVQVREYTGQALPSRRAEFLAQAVEAMLNARYAQVADERRLLREAVGGWQHHRRLLGVLAFDMMIAGARDLTEDRLRGVLRASQPNQPISSRPIHEAHIEALIQFANSRGGLLRRQPDGRYRFIHLSIQQWLCAWHVIEREMTPDALVDFFVADDAGVGACPIASDWWREVALLVAGLRRESPVNSAGDTDKLVAFLQALAARARCADLSPAARFACAEVVVRAADELLDPAHPARSRLTGPLAAVVDDEAAMHTGALPARLALTQWLTRHGDPRPHVMSVDAMRFCYVPAGPFHMGSLPDDTEAYPAEKCDDPAFNTHGFEIPYAYLIGQHPITNAQYAAFIADDGYTNPAWWTLAAQHGVWQDGRLLKRALVGPRDAITLEQKWQAYQAGRVEEALDWMGPDPELLDRIQRLPNHPATYITWYEAMAFCDWLTARWRSKGWLAERQQARLPKEPEWEKAARGGLAIPVEPLAHSIQEWSELLANGQSSIQNLKSRIQNPTPRRRYPWGDLFDLERANVYETGLRETTAAGCFASGRSPYGCHDMSGNVWEWTRNLWGPVWFEHHRYHDRLSFPYPYDPDDGREAIDAGPDFGRVLRGGSWYFNLDDARAAFRDRLLPNLRVNLNGFRVVAAPVQDL